MHKIINKSSVRRHSHMESRESSFTNNRNRDIADIQNYTWDSTTHRTIKCTLQCYVNRRQSFALYKPV